jgi:ubiquitin-conjugating enzyme E2 Z
MDPKSLDDNSNEQNEVMEQNEIVSPQQNEIVDEPTTKVINKIIRNTVFITNDTIKRLLKDIKHIRKNPLTEHGIHYMHDDEDMMKGYALIVGQEGTPYFGGYYLFEINFPQDYPFNPPKAVFLTNAYNIRFNPNLYENGKVCISILNTWRGEKWTPCQTISTVLLSISTVLSNNPLLNEPGVYINNPQLEIYNHIVEYANMKIAVYEMLTKSIPCYEDRKEVFDNFMPVMKEQFLLNREKILKILCEKCLEFPRAKKMALKGYYRTSIKFEYKTLKKQMEGLTEEYIKNIS